MIKWGSTIRQGSLALWVLNYTVKKLRVNLYHKTSVKLIKTEKFFNPNFLLKNFEILNLFNQKVGVKRIYYGVPHLVTQAMLPVRVYHRWTRFYVFYIWGKHSSRTARDASYRPAAVNVLKNGVKLPYL